LDDHGVVAYRSMGRGWKRRAGTVHAELLLAQATGTRERLKACQNPDCRAAFYDRSRNSSSVWHDTKLCGNAINLRASRARRASVAPKGLSPADLEQVGANAA
jgi:predicted RNA-binding Zn ribbon-like protein